MQPRTTRKEITNTRDLQFSSWIRENMPDSYATGYRVTDLDFILYDVRQKQFMLVEAKTRNAPIRKQQRLIFHLIHYCIKTVFELDREGTLLDGWTYCGFHLVTFTNTNFSDGFVKFDNKVKTENELKQILSLGKNSGCCPMPK